ncbi:unnamed protein product, partial [Linum tenue]
IAALCRHCGDARRPCSCGACSSTSSNTAEPSLRRSRSLAVAIPFLRSSTNRHPPHAAASDKAAPTPAPAFWAILKGGGASAKKKDDVAAAEEEEEGEQLRRMTMRKSRSVAVTSADAGRSSWKGSGGGRGWHFPSPMKVFRQSKSSARGGGGLIFGSDGYNSRARLQIQRGLQLRSVSDTLVLSLSSLILIFIYFQEYNSKIF